MESTGCARTSHEGEASHENPARDAPDGQLFPQWAQPRVMPPHGVISKDIDSRYGQEPGNGGLSPKWVRQRGTVPVDGS